MDGIDIQRILDGIGNGIGIAAIPVTIADTGSGPRIIGRIYIVLVDGETGVSTHTGGENEILDRLDGNESTSVDVVGLVPVEGILVPDDRILIEEISCLHQNLNI